VRLLLISWSRSLVSNFKIETKNDASVNCDFDVTTLVSQELKFDIRKNRNRTGFEVEFVESESE